MSITELAIHNVLRTYSRQDRLGRLQRPRPASATATADKLDLSPKAQKLAALGKTAEELVAAGNGNVEGADRENLVRGQLTELVRKHGAELENQAVAPETFAASLKAAYLKK